MDTESRSISFEESEIRAETTENGFKITGYAAVYDRRSLDLGGFTETIARGAFDEVMKDDVIAVFNHNPDIMLGRASSGTLRLTSDARGLRYEVDLPKSRQDIAELIERRDIVGSSFKFRVASGGDKWERDSEGRQLRQITKFARLFDVGPVVTPAYPDASVAMRSLKTDAQQVQKTSCEWLRIRLKTIDAQK